MKYFYVNTLLLTSHLLHASDIPNPKQQAKLANTLSLFEENKGQGIEVADNAATNNTNVNVTHTLEVNDVIQLLWNGTDWLEISLCTTKNHIKMFSKSQNFSLLTHFGITIFVSSINQKINF